MIMSETLSVDECRRKQADEIEILESIYGTDFSQLRKTDFTKNQKPLEILIALYPQQGSSRTKETHVSVKLRIRCSPTYPLQKPEIFLQDPVGLSKDDVRKLKLELEDIAKAKSGEVVIFELTEKVREFLYLRNLPPKQSFHEQMLNSRAEKKRMEEQMENQMRNQALQIEQDKIQQINEEYQRRRQMAKEYRRNRSISQKASVRLDVERTSVSEDTSVDNYSNVICSIEEHRSVQTKQILWLREDEETPSSELSYKNILCGACISDSCSPCQEKHHSVRHAVDQTTGQAVALIEWRFPLLLRKTVDNSVLAGIKKDVSILCRLEHTNLAKYFGYEGSVTGEDDDESKICLIQLVSEYIGGPSLATYIRKQRALPLDYLRTIARDVLSVLEYLHKMKLAHKSLRASCVMMNSAGIVKVTDYNIDKRLMELCDSCCKSNRKFSKSSKQTAKSLFRADIFQYGLLLLEAAIGNECNPDSPEIDSNLVPSFREFIIACLSRDDETVISIEQLSKHSFLFDDIRDLALPNLQKLSPETNVQNKISSDNSGREHDLIVKASSEGRMNTEFEILNSIGEGAFGRVFKVRNRIDGRYYAIKQVSMVSRDSRFIKKITREVELLARLKHENIVRYYTSWFETVYESDTADSSDVQNSDPSLRFNAKKDQSMGDLLGLNNVEAEAPQCNNDVGRSDCWSKWGSDEDEDDNEEDSESSSDDDNNAFTEHVKQFGKSDQSDDFIQFGSKSVSASESNDATVKRSDFTFSSSSSALVAKKYLNIQMELCAKSTLRRAIDEESLHLDSKRYWRLFREVVEGLAHIHTQQMIHRDLKPGNIFLDDFDHVKIGDFGLATKGKIVQSKEQMQLLQMSDVVGGDSLTANLSSTQGVVGTFLYSAPEGIKNKSEITQKFDIYSLGIIFVEMCSHLPTKMERAALLHNARLTTIDLPDTIKEREKKLVKWLLHHNPEERPTSQEILKSDLLPPLELEETAFLDKVKSTVGKPGSKLYKRIMDCMFEQIVPFNDDYLYDHFPQTWDPENFEMRLNTLLQIVNDSIIQFEKVFSRHGALNFSPPLLLPKGADSLNCQCEFLDRNGMIVMLPCEQRLPFARYIAKNGIAWMKRFAFTRSYRKHQIYGTHPIENLECAFDIVGLGHVMYLHLELICVLRELILTCSILNRRKSILLVNNTKFFEIILRCFNIPEDKIADFKNVCHTHKKPKSRHKMLESYFETIQQIRADQQEQLETLLNTSGPIDEVFNKLGQICKSKQACYNQFKKHSTVLSETVKLIESIDQYPKLFEIRVSLDLVDSNNVYDGFIFQFISSKSETQLGKKSGKITLASGGQYEHVINKFMLNSKEQENFLSNRYAVGFTLYLNQVSNLHLQTTEQNICGLDVLICTNDKTDALKFCILLCQKLWEQNIVCDMRLLDDLDLDQLDSLCRVRNIVHLLVITAGGESNNQRNLAARLRTYDHKGQKSDQTENITCSQSFTDSIVSKLSASKSSVTSQSIAVQQQPVGGASYYSRNQESCNFVADKFEIIFVEKESKKSIKIYTAQIRSRLKPLQEFAKIFLYVLATEVSDDVLTTFSSELRLIKTEKQFGEMSASIEKKHPHYRNSIPKICDFLQQFKFQKQQSMVVLYSLKDSTFAVIQLVN